MRKILRGCVKVFFALSMLGPCTAIVGLAIGNDVVYWVGMVLAAPLYLYCVFLLISVAIMIIANFLGIVDL